jgi:NADH:ubiquinone oxidoreductase subunit K
MARPKRRPGGGGKRLAALVFIAPLFIFVAALGTRTGLWSYGTGHDQMMMRFGVVLATMAVLAGLALLVAAFRRRAPIWLAGLAVIVAALTFGGLAWHMTRITSGPPDDISTDLTEIPGFGPLAAVRGDAGPAETGGVEACPDAVPVLRQAPPATAAWALQQAGFNVRGSVTVSRAVGSQRGFWFGTTHDAVIRIRPGRTDIRVAARDGRPHGGEACRLTTRLSELLRGE